MWCLFVQKFLDGLRYNISNAITLYRPQTVDAALSLALMQEELLEASNRRYSGRQRVLLSHKARVHLTWHNQSLYQRASLARNLSKTNLKPDLSGMINWPLSKVLKEQMACVWSVGSHITHITDAPSKFHCMCLRRFWTSSKWITTVVQEVRLIVRIVMKKFSLSPHG